MERRRFRVRGVVQGVGFRPFVYGLAARHGLGGFVLNDGEGVVIEAEGDPASLRAFAASLFSDAPPLARVEAVTVESLHLRGEERFTIAPSRPSAGSAAAIPPDVATCDDCLRELFDPADRRYRYPFLNCTQCGPRFTIVRGGALRPADRRRWPASRCAPTAAASTRTPGDRRFHAEPIACPACGPQLSMPLEEAVSLLAAARSSRSRGSAATTSPATRRGRGRGRPAARRKRREEKPFALMTAAPEELCDASGEEWSLLRSRARPIVLLRRRHGAAVAEAVAPGSPWLGVMLPYTPLHHLLRADFGGAARDDERQPLGRADRLRGRRGARAPRRDRRRLPRARPADPPPLRGLGRARRPSRSAARAATRPARCRCRGARARSSPPAPSSRARSASRAATRPSSRRTSATSTPSRPTARSAPISSSTSRCSTSSPTSSPTTSTPSTSRRSGRSSRTPSSSASSTTTRTPRRASPSTASRARRSRSSSTAPATAPTGRSGAASSCAATSPASSAWRTSSRCRCPAARRRSASRGARRPPTSSGRAWRCPGSAGSSCARA